MDIQGAETKWDVYALVLKHLKKHMEHEPHECKHSIIAVVDGLLAGGPNQLAATMVVVATLSSVDPGLLLKLAIHAETFAKVAEPQEEPKRTAQAVGKLGHA